MAILAAMSVTARPLPEKGGRHAAVYRPTAGSNQLGYARYVGRVGALAVALGVGLAIATTPGVAWAEDGTGEDTSSVDTGTGTPETETTPQDDGNATAGAVETGTTTTTTTTVTDGQTSTVIGGEGSPQVTISATTIESTGTTEPSETATPTATATPGPTIVTPTQELVPTSDPTTVTSAPSVEPAPAPTVGGADSRPTTTSGGDLGNATVFNTLTDTDDTAPGTAMRLMSMSGADDQLNLLSANLVGDDLSAAALDAPPLPAPAPVSSFEALLAVPVTFFNAVFNAFSASIAPIFGPGAPFYNAVFWGLVESTRRQYNQAYANSTPVLDLQTTGQQDVDDRQIHGTLGGFDPDGDTLTYGVPTSGAGAPAHGSVAIDATAGTWTYTPAPGYSGTDTFTITVTDEVAGYHFHGIGQTHSASDSITVTVAPPAAANRPPVATGDSVGVSEGGTANISVLTNDTDPDGAATIVANSVAVVTAPTHGSATANADGTITYVSNGAGGVAADSFTYTVKDASGATSNTATVSVTINPVNDAPVVATTAGSTSYTAQGSPVLVDTGLTIADSDSTTLSGATVTLAGATADETLDFTAGNGITGNYDADTGILTLTGTSTVANYQAALRSVTYANTGEPAPTSRILTYAVTDGAAQSVPVSKAVAIGDVQANTAPELSVSSPFVHLPTGEAHFGVEGVDFDHDDMTFTIVQPTHGTVSTFNSYKSTTDVAQIDSFQIIYTPSDAARKDATTYTDQFTVIVDDGRGQQTVKVVTVEVIKEASLTANQPLPYVGTTTLSGEVSAPFSNILRYRILTDPIYGEARMTNVNGRGMFSYDTFMNLSDLNDSFTIVVESTDGKLASVVVPVGGLAYSDPHPTLQEQLDNGLPEVVTPFLMPPSLMAVRPAPKNPSPFKLENTSASSGTSTGKVAVPGENISYEGSTTGPLGTVVVHPDGTYSFTPSAEARALAAESDEILSVLFLVRATDSEGNSTPVAVTVPLLPSNYPTTPADPAPLRFNDFISQPGGLFPLDRGIWMDDIIAQKIVRTEKTASGEWDYQDQIWTRVGDPEPVEIAPGVFVTPDVYVVMYVGTGGEDGQGYSNPLILGYRKLEKGESIRVRLEYPKDMVNPRIGYTQVRFLPGTFPEDQFRTRIPGQVGGYIFNNEIPPDMWESWSHQNNYSELVDSIADLAKSREDTGQIINWVGENGAIILPAIVTPTGTGQVLIFKGRTIGTRLIIKGVRDNGGVLETIDDISDWQAEYSGQQHPMWVVSGGPKTDPPRVSVT